MLSQFASGIGVVTGDQLNTFEQSCDQLVQLRNFTGKTGMQVYVRGFATPGDGGQGVFYWNATSTASDNGTSVIVPTGTTQGAWLRLSADGALGLTVTGALSLVTDANAQAVLQSLVAALAALGLITDDTT